VGFEREPAADEQEEKPDVLEGVRRASRPQRAKASSPEPQAVESHPLLICHVTPMGFAATETGVEVRRSNPTPSAILTHSFDPGGIQT